MINAAGAVVVLKGLDIDGSGTGLAGIAVPTAATRLEVTDTIISNNGAASTGGGIRIRPTATGTVLGAAAKSSY